MLHNYIKTLLGYDCRQKEEVVKILSGAFHFSPFFSLFLEYIESDLKADYWTGWNNRKQIHQFRWLEEDKQVRNESRHGIEPYS